MCKAGSVLGCLAAGLLAVLVLLSAPAARAGPLDRETLAPLVVPPFSLGEPLGDQGVWQLLNSGGAPAGYVFETGQMAPLPGFSGAPINMLVTLDPEGRFLDVRLLEHNEPIFVSGLGEAPFHKFFEQYRGHSIAETLVVGTPYGEGAEGSALVYLDGVTKATASVRIAHESILAATLQVARERMQGITTGPPAHPDPAHDEPLSWEQMVRDGLVTRKLFTNAQVQALFDGTLWHYDDPEALEDPDGTFLELWIADLGPPAIARAALSEDGFRALQQFLEISPSDEPLLVIGAGRHGLVSEDFVRNTSPDWLSAEQGGLPVALRDADLLAGLHPDLPEYLHEAPRLILRTDRRLGLDPAAEWTLKVSAVREHGMFRPETGTVTLSAAHATPERFFLRPEVQAPVPPWREALRARQSDLLVLAPFLVLLTGALLLGQSRLAGLRLFTPLRLGVLAFVLGFIGWWGQGQLSIVTVLGVLRTALEGGSFAFLLFDPFSLLIWVFALGGLVLWGRGFFCGWLCPYGALQEFAHHLGRALRLPRIEPSPAWDRRLKGAKYAVLAALVATVLLAPAQVDTAAEVEPFKTAITVFFQRSWPFAAYALFWLVLGMVTFKSFCRYACPLGAFMALGGLVRGRDWIPRRAECGSPCQLCKVRCNYGAIARSGRIDYGECFQCLDCVTIHDDPAQCVPLVLKGRAQARRQAAE